MLEMFRKEVVMEEKYFNIITVALLVGCSTKTIENWYMFKRDNPDSEYAKMLPDFIQHGNRQTRYWKQEDIPQLIQFKNSIPHGRNGVLGSTTQRYYKKTTKGNN